MMLEILLRLLKVSVTDESVTLAKTTVVDGTTYSGPPARRDPRNR